MRGFLFGSLSEDVLPLEEYLGETRVIIDQIVDQAPNGLEVLRGNSSYLYDGNCARPAALAARLMLSRARSTSSMPSGLGNIT